MKKCTIGKIAVNNGLLFLVGVIMSFVSAAVTIYSNDLVAEAVDKVMSDAKNMDMAYYIKAIVFVAIIALIATFLEGFVLKLYSVRVQTQYKKKIADRIPDIEYAYFDEKGSGGIMNRLISDVGELNKLFSENIPMMISSVIVITAVMIYMIALDVKLSLVTIIIYPILLYISNIVSNKVKKLVNLRRNLLDERTAIINDCVQGIVVGKSYNLEKQQDERVGVVVDEVFKSEKARTSISSLAFVLETLIGWLPIVISYVVALYEVLNDSITTGEMLAFAVLLNIVSRNIENIPMGIIELKECLVSVKRLNQLLEAPIEKTGTYKGGLDTENAIEFSNVTFSYNQEENVLDGIDFVAKTATQTAIIGSSGGGKSTIFKLICGFYRANGGSYKLFNEDFEKWNLKSARECFSLVSQNVFLLPESIADNIAYGKKNATMDEIIKACKNANIHDFIMSLPQGYDTVVGERGVRLSGGERQRISIARAFLKNAPILLLDEPTSAIDVETEKLIQEAIDRISVGKTVIIIAHRLNTVIGADNIYVLSDGVIKESGTHNELLNQNGIYAELYGKQLLAAAKDMEVAYE
ncbi:MAG: ABC transporter ATP-binding protein [Lachnospiraceae bacterium]|nr:ABC transporter ATP-binding protein [Lachnospiraceae bacterium]